MSTYLDSIINKHNQTCNLQVVFLDIEKYSKRRTSSQVTVINAFTKCVQSTLTEVSKLFIEFTQKNNYNFAEDTIIIPTGDGAAINFGFEGLHDIHLKFSESFLKNLYDHNNSGERCEKFEKDGWCNCHDKFNVRIGVAEGKAVIYKDVNNHYNVAGNVINTAARLLSIAERNQIVFDELAYNQIVDMGEDPNLSDKFIEMKDMEVKHKVLLNVFLYSPDLSYINGTLPNRYITQTKMGQIYQKMESAGLPSFFGPDGFNKVDKKEIHGIFSAILEMLESNNFFEFAPETEIPSPRDIPHKEIPIIDTFKKTRRSK